MADLIAPKHTHLLPKALAAAAGVVVIGSGAYILTRHGDTKTIGANDALSTAQNTRLPSPAATPTSMPAAAAAASKSAYKDGTYSADGSYDTPESSEHISVSVTLQNGLITATNITSTPRERQSQQYQTKFISGYKSLVLGKPIEEVRLSRVSGSSLTSAGFNAALGAIKNQAKA